MKNNREPEPEPEIIQRVQNMIHRMYESGICSSTLAEFADDYKYKNYLRNKLEDECSEKYYEVFKKKDEFYRLEKKLEEVKNCAKRPPKSNFNRLYVEFKGTKLSEKKQEVRETKYIKTRKNKQLMQQKITTQMLICVGLRRIFNRDINKIIGINYFLKFSKPSVRKYSRAKTKKTRVRSVG